MTIDGCGSCACAVINGLSYYSKPEAALKEFFQKTFGTTLPKFGAKPNSLTAHYIFVAGPGSYGKDFAAKIESEGLGKVATLDARQNPYYGGDHKCQVWIWQPNQKACEQWWMESNNGMMEQAKKDEAERVARLEAIKKSHGTEAVFAVKTYGARPDVLGDPTTYAQVGCILKPVAPYNFGGSPEKVLLKNGNYCEKGKMELNKEYLIVDHIPDSSGGNSEWLLIENIKTEGKPIPVVVGPVPKMRWKLDELTGRRKYYYEAAEPVGGVANG